MERFIKYLNEEFNQEELVPLALKWLKNKFPEAEYGFSFEHKPNLTNDTKTYSVTIDGKCFDIVGRIFDANGDGKESEGDVVQFKIVASEEEPQEEEKEPAF